MTPTPTKARRQTNASSWLRHFIFPFVAAVFDRCKCSKIHRSKELLVHILVRRQSAEYMAGPVMLIIRDGWGINPGGRGKRKQNGDATLLALTPFHDELYQEYPSSTLSASGVDVGLPEGQMGNSEVGHLNLGAGRIVYQDLTRINKAIADGELKRNDVLQNALTVARGHRL